MAIDVDDLIIKIEDGLNTYSEEVQSPVFFTIAERDYIIDALSLYKEMNF